jgi:hypothetical protein
MSQFHRMMPAGSRIGSDSNEIDQAGGARSGQLHDVREIRRGTPEHAALVEALRREFPELYHRARKCLSVRRSKRTLLPCRRPRF